MPAAARPPGDEPVYMKIHNDLLWQIKTGKMSPGQQLPSVASVAKEYGVARPTAQKAFEALKHGGHIVAVSRRGYYVQVIDRIDWRMSAVADTGTVLCDPWAIAVKGDRAGHELTEVRVIPANTLIGDEHLHDLLGLAPDAEVLCRQALRSLDNAPRELVSYYMPYDLAKDTPAVRQDLPGGPLALLASLGYAEVSAEDAIAARAPDKVEADRLELDPGIPVLVATRRSLFAPENRCLLVRHSVYSSHGATFRYAIRT